MHLFGVNRGNSELANRDGKKLRLLATEQRLSILSVGGAALILLAACAEGQNNANERDASSPVMPSSVSLSPSQEASGVPDSRIDLSSTIDVAADDTSMGISSVKYQTPQQIGERFIYILDQWHNSGSPSEIMNVAIHSDNSVEELSDQAASVLDDQYVAALFDPQALTDSKTAAAVAGIKESHRDTLYKKTLTTDSSDSRDKQPYARQMKIISIEPDAVDSNTVSVTVKYHESDNADMNRIGTVYGAGNLDSTDTVQLTFKKSAGQWLVTKANFVTS